MTRTVRTSRAPIAVTAVVLVAATLTACGPALRIDAAAPVPVAPGAVIDVAGAGFADGLALALSSPGVSVNLQSVKVTSTTAASGVVPAAAPPGTYDLVATLDGGRAVFGGVRVVAGGMQVHFLDVGQGDATLVVAPTGEALLIDGGPPEAQNTLSKDVQTLAGGRLDAVVLTHYHADHMGGLVPLLAGADGSAGSADDLVPATRWAYVDDGQCTSDLCGRARHLRAWPFTVVSVGDSFNLGDVVVDAVAADGDTGSGKVSNVVDPNERSVAVRLTFAGRTVLVEGDLTGGGDGNADVEGPASQSTGAVDVLRTGHHGSNTSSNATALSRWHPRALVISVGTDNDFCHPSAPALTRMGALAAPIYATGDGITQTSASCSSTTAWPPQARHGVGNVDLVVGTDGSMTIAGDPIP